MLDRVPGLAAQSMIAGGLVIALFAVAAPAIDANAGAGARAELQEKERYLTLSVEEFARINELSMNHSLEVRNHRRALEDELDMPNVRRRAAASVGAGAVTGWMIVLLFLGIASLSIGSLIMLLRAEGIGRLVYLLLFAIAIWAGGIGLSRPTAPTFRTTSQLPGGPGPAAHIGTANVQLMQHVAERI